MKILGIIPALGGLKGIPHKSVRLLGRKPLIQYSIEVAFESNYITDVMVSTDDEGIASVSETFGAEVIRRPDKMAADPALVMDAVGHIIDTKKLMGREYDYLLLLEPTAPFSTGEDIDASIEMAIKHETDSAATLSETGALPTQIWRITDLHPEPLTEGPEPFLPLQSHKKEYLNGVEYFLKTSMLESYLHTSSFLIGKTCAYIIPRERVVDIDTEMDLFIAEQLFKTQEVFEIK